MTIKEKLDSINGFNVWAFTKQNTDFEDAFKAAKLFYEMPSTANQNLESYFAQNYSRYGISTNRHRVLIIAQMYGLITKTPFFSRGSSYKNEKVTEVFEELNKYPIGSDEFNTIKTEQIMKLRVEAVIDNAGSRNGFAVLPLIFSFMVLWKLKKEKNIDGVSINKFFTYVMTSKSFDEIDEVVEFLANPNAPVSKMIAQMKSNSRVLTLFKENTKLFEIGVGQKGIIKLNDAAAQYFYDNFISLINFNDLIDVTTDIGEYAYFLNNVQGYNINLLQSNFVVPKTKIKVVKKKRVTRAVKSKENDSEFDGDYVGSVNEVNERNINPNIAKGASSHPVTVSGSTSTQQRIHKNPIYGKIAIMNSNYKCEHDAGHITFNGSSNGKPFMEAHHLVPIGKAVDIWNTQHVNIDCVENLVSLCPNCHSAIHYGDKATRKAMVTDLYNKKKHAFKKIGLSISLDDLLDIYNCK